jgi:type III pantothenate kinase
MNLVIDIGNTLTKIGVFESNQLLEFQRMEGSDLSQIATVSLKHAGLKAAIISSVSVSVEELLSAIRFEFTPLVLNQRTLLPFRNLYTTPETLGKDRLAGVAAAHHYFPNQDALVIDAGTAITYDLITSAGEYLGGGISPGIRMRYRALHTFTERLPLLEMTDHIELIGNSTHAAIHSGIMNGILIEVAGLIEMYRQHYPGLKIILTGGDYNYFDKQLKVKTFAAPNLVLEGLNHILNYNLEKQKD